MRQSVPYLAEADIERDTVALLAEFGCARRVTVAPPIPIEDIVEKHLKLGIEFDDTHKLFGVPRESEANPDILGAMFFDEARIVIDESLDPDEHPSKEGRYRFTVAHEGGGHWRLHRQLFAKRPQKTVTSDATTGRAVVCRSSQAKARVEWQADFYASCLLMPKKLVFEEWSKRFRALQPFVFDDFKYDPRWRRPESTWVSLGTAMLNALSDAAGVSTEVEHVFAFNRIATEFAAIFD